MSFSENISDFGGCTDSFSKDDVKETHNHDESAWEKSLLLSCSSLFQSDSGWYVKRKLTSTMMR